MDYRVIGHETLELDFDNQKVPDSRRFLCENSSFWLFSIKIVLVSEKMGFLSTGIVLFRSKFRF